MLRQRYRSNKAIGHPWVFRFINLYLSSRHYLSTLSSSFNFSRLLLTAYTKIQILLEYIAWRSLTVALITSQSLTSASQSLWNHNNQSFAPDIEQELAFCLRDFFISLFFLIHERENSIDVESDQKNHWRQKFDGEMEAYNRRSDNFFFCLFT